MGTQFVKTSYAMRFTLLEHLWLLDRIQPGDVLRNRERHGRTRAGFSERYSELMRQATSAVSEEEHFDTPIIYPRHGRPGPAPIIGTEYSAFINPELVHALRERLGHLKNNGSEPLRWFADRLEARLKTEVRTQQTLAATIIGNQARFFLSESVWELKHASYETVAQRADTTEKQLRNRLRRWTVRLPSGARTRLKHLIPSETDLAYFRGVQGMLDIAAEAYHDGSWHLTIPECRERLNTRYAPLGLSLTPYQAKHTRREAQRLLEGEDVKRNFPWRVRKELLNRETTSAA